MEIIKVTPRGYCRGVVRAINIAKETAKQYPEEQIYILGMLVHNEYVKKALATYGIITLEDKTKSREQLLTSITKGVVIFTAHGISKKIKQQAIDKSLIVVDATCPDVLKTQILVDQHLEEDYEILYIGKKGHPEASAICDDRDHLHLIETEEDLNFLPNYKKVFVTNQTTMSIYDVDALFNKIKEKYPQAIISEEICDATRTRQEAITKLDNDVELLIIIGDKASNNSKRLVQIGKEHNIPNVILIDDVNDLAPNNVNSYKKIAISSGASTPTYLTKQVIQCLEEGFHEKQIIQIEDIL